MASNILFTLLGFIKSINDKCVEFKACAGVLNELQEQNSKLEKNLNLLFADVNKTPLQDELLKNYFHSVILACLKTISDVHSFLVQKLPSQVGRFVFSNELLETCEKYCVALRDSNALIDSFRLVLINRELSDMRERITKLDKILNDLFDLLQKIFLEIHKNNISSFVDNFLSSSTWQHLLQLFPILVLVQRWWEENKNNVMRQCETDKAPREKFNLDDQIRITMEVFHEGRFYADTDRGDFLYNISKSHEFYWYEEGYNAFIIPILESIKTKRINTEVLVHDIHACFNEAVVITKNVWLYHEFHTTVKHLLRHYTSEDRKIFTYIDLKTTATREEYDGYVFGSYSYSNTNMKGKLKVKAFRNDREKREWLEGVLGISYN